MSFLANVSSETVSLIHDQISFGEYLERDVVFTPRSAKSAVLSKNGTPLKGGGVPFESLKHIIFERFERLREYRI